MSCSFLVIVGSHFKNTVFFWRISFFIYFGLHIHILLLFYIFYIFIFYFIMFLKASSCCDAKICSAGIYYCKVNNGNTRKRSEISSKLTIKTSERVACWIVITVWEVSKYEFFLVRIFLYPDQKSVHAVYL